jgi:hypothetical protein
MSLLKQVKTVLWSFFGVGQRKDMNEIYQRGNPLMLILIAFILVILFLASLALIAHKVAHG